MRLLTWINQNQIGLTLDLHDDERPPYAILSHTWAPDNTQEVTFAEVETGEGQQKTGYAKIRFCAEQARKDGIEHFWVDTCCIDKTNNTELSRAITSMFRWYQDAVKCYVYLADVSHPQRNGEGGAAQSWESGFRQSRWFTRGWTLQELLAPKIVEFFSRERILLGDKKQLASQIHQVTKIPTVALDNTQLAQFATAERMRWAQGRETREQEDKAYSLVGLFGVSIPLIYGEGEKQAFRRLQRAIQEQKGDITQPTNVHWMVPRTANPLFTGRQGLLKEIEDTVRDAVYCPWERDQCRVVIWGIGGQGKSEVCLQLARRLRPVFWATLWIDVSTRDIAERSLLDAARKLSIPAQGWEDALYGIANLSHPWLLILDNADDPNTDYLEYFPDSRHGMIVMTSRNQECEQYATDQSVKLSGLDMPEAQELLLKAARVPSRDHTRYEIDAQRVASLLQSHPLALVQAGAYIARGHCSLADYPRIYERQRQRLLTFRPTQARSRYGDVYTTFEVSAEMLQAMDTPASRDALQLLPLLAVCGPSQFPLSLFEAGWQGAQQISPDLADATEDEEVELLTPWHVAHLPAICDAANEIWDFDQLVEAVNLLKAFSLVSADEQNEFKSVSVHPLVHAWARDRQTPQQQQQTWVQMGCLAAIAVGHGDLTHNQKRQIQPHMEAWVSWSFYRVVLRGPTKLIARILVRCGRYLLDQRADAKLYTFLQETFTSLELDSLKVEQTWVGLYDLAALAFYHHGKTKDAIVVLEQVVKIRKQITLEDRSPQLYSQHALAIAYRANGQVQEAVALLKEVVKIQNLTLAAEHPARLASQHELAMAYHANGQVREAVALLEEVVEIRRQTLAVDHPSRLRSQHNLATYLWDTGDREAALSLMAYVVNTRQQVLDAHYPDRQGSEEWLAHFEEEMADLELS